MQPNPFRWVEIYVQDMARARAFYETVLQGKLERLEPPSNGPSEIYAFPMTMEGGGAGGALVKMEGFPSGCNSIIPYFGCADCSVEAARVLKAGGKIERDKFSIGQYGFIALAYDTEGNMFGLHSMDAADCAQP